MKNIFLLIFNIIYLPSLLLAQGTVIFEDNFSNNSNAWALADDKEAFLKIENGKYTFECKLENISKFSWHKVEIDSKRDFSISCNTFWVSGINNNSFDLAWGILDADNAFSFGISADGNYCYNISISGKLTRLIPWTKSEFINKKGSNKLKIAKEGSLVKFYINENKVNQYNFDDFFGNNVGFRVSQNQKVLFDDLVVTYLDNKEVVSSKEVQKTEIPNVAINNNPVTTNEKRLALVIGNSNYTGGSVLKNPVNDANLMAKTLQNLGFEVIKRVDANKQSMEQAIRDFSKKLPTCNVALFYYAGHGVQVDGLNYLIPTDAKLNEKIDCKFEAVSVNYVVEEFEKYPNNVNVVILDACRNDPFRSWARGGERGFKAISPTSGTIISFATSEGSTASDGSGTNGLFTQELVKQMSVPQPIESVFKKTRVQVQKLSNGGQSPQEWSQLTGDFYFKK